MNRTSHAASTPLQQETSRHTVLAVFAHPDDAELSCFGTLASLAESGGEAHVLVLSAGEQSASHDNSARFDHAQRAGQLIGATTHRQEFQDGYLATDIELIQAIEHAITDLNPNIVITHSTDLGFQHQDHSAVGTATSIAVHRHPAVKLLLHAEPPVNARGFDPSVFVDVSRHMELKLRAIACHKSERTKPYLSEKAVRLRGRWWTSQVHPLLANPNIYHEAFVLGRCIVSDIYFSSLHKS